MATPLGYVIQIDPYQGAGTTSKVLGLGGSMVIGLVSKLPQFPNQNYHIIFDNFFTSPQLLKTLSDQGMAGTGTLCMNQTMNAPLNDVDKMMKLSCVSYDQ